MLCMTFTQYNLDSQIPLSQTTITPIRKIGSSEGVFLTNPIHKIGLSPDKDALVRISVPTKRNKDIDDIADRIENGSYVPINTRFTLHCDSEEYYHPSKFYGPNVGAIIDQAQILFETTNDLLIGFCQEKLNTEFAFFSPDTSEFIRTYPPDSPYLDFFDQEYVDSFLIKEELTVDYVLRLVKALNLDSSKLNLTRDVVSILEQSLDVYNIILSSSDDHAAIVEELNLQWKTSSSVKERKAGYYIVVYGVKDDRFPKGSIVGSATEVVFALAESSIGQAPRRNGKKFPQFPADIVLRPAGIFGPLTKDHANEFKSYIDTAIRLEPGIETTRSLSRFCENQYQKYAEVISKESSSIKESDS